MSPQSASRFMSVVAIIGIISGIMFALGGTMDIGGINDHFFHLVSSGGMGIAGIDTAEARLALVIAGGVFAGFSAFFLYVIAPAIAEGNERIKKAGILSLIIWFVTDSGGSIISGNPMNAFANVGFLVLYALPVLLARKEQA